MGGLISCPGSDLRTVEDDWLVSSASLLTVKIAVKIAV